jgi:ubiquinone biosynthesis protein COQ9
MPPPPISLGRLVRIPRILPHNKILLFHSYSHPAQKPPSPYNATQIAILSAALKDQVGPYGFSQTALSHAARSVSFPDISIRVLCPRGPFDLVHYHLVSQRQRVEDVPGIVNEPGLDVSERIRRLCIYRLRGNTAVIGHWQEALALMAASSANATTAIRELAALADALIVGAGEARVDMGWYARRAGVGAVYAAAGKLLRIILFQLGNVADDRYKEMFMTQDKSEDFKDTWAFLNRRLSELEASEKAVKSVCEYGLFSVGALWNVANSKNLRMF